MNLHKLILTENECYKVGRTITPRGILVHSTGANNPTLKRYVNPNDGLLGKNLYNNHWNQFRPAGRQVCVHGFIGKLENGTVATYQTLPWNYRGWHGGSGANGSVNNTHISFEMCEDGLNDVVYFNKIYKEATELCAYLCKLYNLNEKTIIGHYEGHQLGIASNHGDPRNWFSKFGKNMDTFRADVKKLLGGVSQPIIVKPPVVVQPPIVKPLPNTLPNLVNGKRTFTYKDLNFYEFPVSKLQLEYWDRPKNSANFPVFCNAGFFAYYKEKVSGIDKYFTLPVGNLCCYATYLTQMGRKYLEEWTGKKITNQVKINANQNPRNNFKNVSTLVISNNNTAKIIDSNTLPEDCKFAISGVPTIRNGDDVSWGSYVKPQGWESGMYATYRNWIAITKTGSMLLISGKTSTNNYIYGMEFWNKVKDLNLIQDCIALDGGGSFIKKNQGVITKTSENRQINSVLVIK